MAKTKGEIGHCSICGAQYRRTSKAEADKRARECEKAGEPEYQFEVGALVWVNFGVFIAGQSGPWRPSPNMSLLRGVSYLDKRKDSALQALVMDREIYPPGPGHMPVYILESYDGRIHPSRRSKVFGEFLTLVKQEAEPKVLLSRVELPADKTIH